ncbi:anthranilate synthase component I [Legionella sp. W05-934-2]|jgi:anthranilate synthase|uniref:anthranilate synthase component I n=1 Tax=Legionella sp. W05-934-2 TaxID=1198649 RepID=UPI003461A22D
MIFQFKTAGDVLIEMSEQTLPYEGAIETLIERLDQHRGAIYTSGFEFPGRYTCWDIGFVNPPIVITSSENQLTVQALNQRGQVLVDVVKQVAMVNPHISLQAIGSNQLIMEVNQSEAIYSEEERSKQPSVFSLIRSLLAAFHSEKEDYLGLYGAYGYDLIFQFDQLTKKIDRPPQQRDMVIYLPDEIYVVDHSKEIAFVRRYDFIYQGRTTHSYARDGELSPYQPAGNIKQGCDHQPGEYANLVEKAKQKFACGDLFEVVPSQSFYQAYQDKPSILFRRMRHYNPAPYGFYINLGEGEFLVGASPEMYVRLQGKRVETCPISGTIKRGNNAIEDAINIQTLLASEKEEAELTMCTDVDRNDKSRICEAGSVKVIGRRQIEMYSRLIHTVDHVEGILRHEYDAVDAFLTHMWVVTVTGAPKLWAMQFIEDHEKSSRKWYAGAVGWFGFNGDLNTGLVLRTVQLSNGVANIRVGATLLYDSVPADEEAETRLKASAFLEMLNPNFENQIKETEHDLPGHGKQVLLVDHQDSFVHTLANYFRQTGAEVMTCRYDKLMHYLTKHNFDWVVLSPGPGKPSDFDLSQTIEQVLKRNIPIFGVCLGLQGIVEYFGGQLKTLSYPMHGKTSNIIQKRRHPLFNKLDDCFVAGRYHSLYADKNSFPECLSVLAETEDGIVMAVAHNNLPIYAVQFHPETILSMTKQAGLTMIYNLMELTHD